MNIAGTGDQVLLGFRVELGIEGRILIMQTSKTGGDLLLNALYLRRARPDEIFSSAPLTLGWMPCV